MSSDIAIKVENLGKSYQIYDKPRDRLLQMLFRGRKQYYKDFWALKDISLEIRKGETVGIIGLNGSGKSTLLQMIAGTLSPTTGSVKVTGRVAAMLELGSGFNPEFTGRENVYMNGAILGLPKEEIDLRFEDIASFAAIGDFIEQPVKYYSSGMMMRLAFAVSVCVDPDVLIVDEALSVGDAAFQFKCMERLKLLTASGTTLLFVSHDIGTVKSFCDHVLYLEKGLERLRGSADIVAEQYFQDIRDEQRRHIPGGLPVFRKKGLGSEENSIAFGTDQGSITSARFNPEGGARTVVQGGETVSLRVEMEYEQNLRGASLSFILTDRRLIDFGGRYFKLEPNILREGRAYAAVEIEFDARLAPGNYFITLRLESRGMGNSFFPIDKQTAALSFDVAPYQPNFISMVDMDIRGINVVPQLTIVEQREKRIVALLAVRNEALYLSRCLEHLYLQGIETCVIDNESTDETRAIAESFMGRGVFRIETQPYSGYFDLSEQLRLKEKLASEIHADWFIHHDADEIFEAPAPFLTLREGILAADQRGYNLVNFDEFVFLPTSDADVYESGDYIEQMEHYYFFEPRPMRLIRAWKKSEKPIDLVSSGGHRAQFEESRVCPENFILRHYIVLSREHAIAKYGRERVYSIAEIEERGWHGPRATFTPDNLCFPDAALLKKVASGIWDKSAPWVEHTFLGKK